ncbi:hypothetical protein CBS9595_000210 [Malassezia furfur]|nr:hypothetical protein CBS9595_000210 [Malassezia furfur]
MRPERKRSRRGRKGAAAGTAGAAQAQRPAGAQDTRAEAHGAEAHEAEAPDAAAHGAETVADPTTPSADAADADAAHEPDAVVPPAGAASPEAAAEAPAAIDQDTPPASDAAAPADPAAPQDDAEARSDASGSEASGSYASDSEALGSDAPGSDVSDDEEPMYNYVAIGWSARDIFARDALSACAVSAEHIALGMASGMIYVLNKDGLLHKGFSFHTAAVQQIVLDTTGTFVGSAGLDGCVAIASLHTSEQYRFDFPRPMQALALEPHFGQRSSRAFVCGGMGGALLYREKRWFGHKETVLHAGEGPIWAIAWRDRWIAWANDRGVRIVDAHTHDLITRIAAPEPGVRAELAPYTLVWHSPTSLLVAQGQRITIARVHARNAAAADVLQSVSGLSTLVPGVGAAAPLFYVEITDIFELDCLVAGVAPDGDRLVVLAYVVHADDLRRLRDEGAVRLAHDVQHPELRVINAHGEEVGSDVLDIDPVRLRCRDVHLASVVERDAAAPAHARAERRVLYVAARTQLTAAHPRTARDHIAWLLDRRAYRAALEALEALGSAGARALGFDTAAIGRAYLQHRIAQGDYAGAAALFPVLLRTDAAAWEEMVLLYLDRGELPAVMPHIPTHEPVLSEMVYDMVLVDLLHHDPAQLLATLRTWPASIYSRQAVAAAIQDRAAGSMTLVACLAELYLASHAPGKALGYLLQLRDPTVFALIREHNLFTDVQDKLAQLVALDQDLAGTPRPAANAVTPLLVDHLHSIPIGRAMAQLAPFPWYAYVYLDALFDRDPPLVSEYANELVALYAEFHYAKLMPFLRTMSYVYSFEKAYQVCEAHDYVPEMIFLLGRTGDVRGALNLIIERLHDVRMAVDFVKQQDDAELWDRLLDYARDRPAFLRGLLEHVGGEIDPSRILRLIRPGLAIPGLKHAVIKTLHTIHLQHSLLQGCRDVQTQAVNELTAHYRASLDAARACDAHTRCVVCAAPLLARAEAAVLFFCWHAAHLACVAPDTARAAAPTPFAPVEAPASARYARESAAWVRADPANDALPSLAADRDETRWTPAAQTQAQVQHRAVRRAKQLATLPLAHTGCPVCAERNAYRLEE